MLTLYVDADSCPRNLRQIILKRVMKERIPVFFVADRTLKDVEQAYQMHTSELRSAEKNQGEKDSLALRSVKSPIQQVVVKKGDDSADDWIVAHANPPSLAITHDIPLAGRLVQKGIVVLDDRGKTYTEENMAERLSIRNAMTEFRELGIFSEQHDKMGSKQTKAFSDAFDAMLTRLMKQYP